MGLLSVKGLSSFSAQFPPKARSILWCRRASAKPVPERGAQAFRSRAHTPRFRSGPLAGEGGFPLAGPTWFQCAQVGFQIVPRLVPDWPQIVPRLFPDRFQIAPRFSPESLQISSETLSVCLQNSPKCASISLPLRPRFFSACAFSGGAFALTRAPFFSQRVFYVH